jgi:hypothetical protein
MLTLAVCCWCCAVPVVVVVVVENFGWDTFEKERGRGGETGASQHLAGAVLLFAATWNCVRPSPLRSFLRWGLGPLLPFSLFPLTAAAMLWKGGALGVSGDLCGRGTKTRGRTSVSRFQLVVFLPGKPGQPPCINIRIRPRSPWMASLRFAATSNLEE